jgi:hypothetical protein
VTRRVEEASSAILGRMPSSLDRRDITKGQAYVAAAMYKAHAGGSISAVLYCCSFSLSFLRINLSSTSGQGRFYPHTKQPQTRVFGALMSRLLVYFATL